MYKESLEVTLHGHLHFRAGSTFSVPVWTVPSSLDRTSRCNKVDAVRLYASYRLNLLLLKGQRSLEVTLTTLSEYFGPFNLYLSNNVEDIRAFFLKTCVLNYVNFLHCLWSIFIEKPLFTIINNQVRISLWSLMRQCIVVNRTWNVVGNFGLFP